MSKTALLVTTLIAGLTLLSILIYSTIITDLPNTAALKNINYQTPLKIYSQNNILIAQFGEKKRNPVSYNKVPQKLINAFIASEDQRFYSHNGVDLRGLLRAIVKLVASGKKKQGGSTITMQVARNFLLTREKTYTRKIKEIILALKIENELTKNEILELYINKIFLGRKAYGVVAAAEVYYGKPLAKLSLAQLAMIAGLPKAPSSLNPINDPDRALIRRNYVLNRMLSLGYVTPVEFAEASAQPITASKQKQLSTVAAAYFSDMVRSEVIELLGDKAYESGLKVYTTLNFKLQQTATRALQKTLHNYDERHGYRGNPIDPTVSPEHIGDTLLATVKTVTENQITAQLSNTDSITISRENFKWALPSQRTAENNSFAQNVQPNTLIRVRRSPQGQWRLSQEPEVEGALISISPQTGAIISLVGGFDFHRSKFNRATQLKRQPGSGFKPILYATALENGYTAASIINDAPIVYEGTSNKAEWRPENYSGKFFGPTRLRTALRKSRNLISIRLLREIGLSKIISTAKRFGLSETQLPKNLTLALGSGTASPLEMSRIFSVFANGGFLIEPYAIERIENNQGDIIFKTQKKIACPSCATTQQHKNNYAPRIISPEVSFLMNSLLQDVVNRGTARRAKALGRKDLAGKTGTTNQQRDAWFNGFSPEITTITWVGYDDSKPLGKKETGGRASLPMWIDYMKTALQKSPEVPLTPPKGIVKSYINPTTGLPEKPTNRGVWEYFRQELVPTQTTEEHHQKTPVNDNITPIESLF